MDSILKVGLVLCSVFCVTSCGSGNNSDTVHPVNDDTADAASIGKPQEPLGAMGDALDAPVITVANYRDVVNTFVTLGFNTLGRDYALNQLAANFVGPLIDTSNVVDTELQATTTTKNCPLGGTVLLKHSTHMGSEASDHYQFSHCHGDTGVLSGELLQRSDLRDSTVRTHVFDVTLRSSAGSATGADFRVNGEVGSHTLNQHVFVRNIELNTLEILTPERSVTAFGQGSYQHVVDANSVASFPSTAREHFNASMTLSIVDRAVVSGGLDVTADVTSTLGLAATAEGHIGSPSEGYIHVQAADGSFVTLKPSDITGLVDIKLSTGNGQPAFLDTRPWADFL